MGNVPGILGLLLPEALHVPQHRAVLPSFPSGSVGGFGVFKNVWVIQPVLRFRCVRILLVTCNRVYISDVHFRG